MKRVSREEERNLGDFRNFEPNSGRMELTLIEVRKMEQVTVERA